MADRVRKDFWALLITFAKKMFDPSPPSMKPGRNRGEKKGKKGGGGGKERGYQWSLTSLSVDRPDAD